MTSSFNLEQTKRIIEIYRRYVGVRHVGAKTVKAEGNTIARAWGITPKYRRNIHFCPVFFKQSRRDQLSTIIHELIHYRRGCANHAKSFKNNLHLWISADR